MTADEKAISLGHPSYVWRYGQERRLALIRDHVSLDDARILDVGCGIGMYVKHFRAFSGRVHGVDVDPERVRQASETLPNIRVGSAEELPYGADSFDVVVLHEVLEHVDDDALAVAEAARVAAPGGHVVVFVPNRLYPFETHGCYWRGRYVFRNVPLVNYLPDPLRNRLCPHVRAYTRGGIRRLFRDLTGELVVHQCIYPGYDKIAARRPGLARVLRAVTYACERSLLSIFGLSHFLVFRVK